MGWLSSLMGNLFGSRKQERDAHREARNSEINKLRLALKSQPRWETESDGEREITGSAVGLLMGRDTSFVEAISYPSRSTTDTVVEDAEVIDLIKSVPVHYGISTVSASIGTQFNALVQNDLTGGVYNPITNTLSISKRYSFGTDAANNITGGGDEVFSFQQAISSSSSATVDLTAMTNLLNQTAVAIVRIKGYQIRLLSATDDSTISPAPTASTTICVTNNGPAVPAPLDFVGGGSGLTVTLTTGATIVTGVAISAAGTGYPRSATFVASPQQVGGSGCIFMVTTNSSGVPTAATFITGGGGTGYSNGVTPTVTVGQFNVYTGGAHMYFDVSAAGFCALSSTAKNILIVNMSTTAVATFELDVLGATS